MYISSMRVKNYKSFVDSGEIPFDPGVNLIVGVNSSGKTALLEVISNQWSDMPHRGPKEMELISRSEVITTYRCTPEDLYDLKNGLILPAFAKINHAELEALLLDSMTSGIDVSFSGSKGEPTEECVGYRIGGRELIPSPDSTIKFTILDSGDTSLEGPFDRKGTLRIEDMIRRFARMVFGFKSERLGPFETSAGESMELESNARNLPEVLQNAYNKNMHRYQQRYMALVRRVLPSVGDVSPQTISNSGVAIRVWPKRQTVDGPEIAFPLKDCGTGVAQVLAMLFVAEYSANRVIVIDEPNSFLHPAAAKELLRAFQANSENQYFISTHSPEIFEVARPKSYTILTYADYESIAESRTYAQLHETFSSLGISPFYERALWVEGETEELTFPMILADPRTSVHKVFNTGDVVRRVGLAKEIDRILAIYETMTRIGNGGSPLLSAMRIVLDSENLPPEKIEDYNRRPDGVIKFIPRKMFENYLLDAEAIGIVVSETGGTSVGIEAIQSELDIERNGLGLAEWSRSAHGADILARIFAKYNCNYEKTTHGPKLVRWLLDHRNNHFAELREFIDDAFVVDMPNA
ncbi:MAG: ATP-dependent endonuclease [Pyrinomonadaceae bacterium]